MASTRQLKFARMIQKELADIFQKDTKSLFHKNLISVTRVSISPDLSVAKIYLSLIIDKEKQKVFEKIDENKKEIRYMLSKKIGKQIRKIPELVFFLDQGAEHASRMDELFRNLDIPPAENDPSNQI
jgi:ribosome-binding factor A